MNYTFTVLDEHSYLIEGNGTRLEQTDISPFSFPYPGVTVEESAQNHINAIIAENETPPSTEQTELEALKIKVDLQEQALSETNATLLDFMEASLLG